MIADDIKDLIAVNQAVIDRADAWLRDYRQAREHPMPSTVVRTAAQMATKSTISPKVVVPAVAQAVAGIVLIVLGAVPSIVDDSDTRSTLLTLGLALVGASGLTGGLGYQAKPGQVVVNE